MRTNRLCLAVICLALALPHAAHAVVDPAWAPPPSQQYSLRGDIAGPGQTAQFKVRTLLGMRYNAV